MSGGGLILETSLFTRRRTEQKCDQCDLDKEAPTEEIEHATKMECLDFFIQKRTPTREGRIILETIWFAQKMASKENEEREHPGGKKTAVKLIYQGQEKKVIIVSTI